MSKKLIRVWCNRINKDLTAMGLDPITASQFRKADTGNAELDEIIEMISGGGVAYATA